MCGLGAFSWQRFIVVLDRPSWIETQSKLITPAKFKTGFGKSIVADLSRRVSLGKISSMSSDLISDHALAHVFAIGKPQMLFGSNITKHCTSVPSDLRRTNPGSEMIVPRSNIRRQRPKRIKRCFMTPFDLLLHVLLNQVHRNVARPFIHHLAALGPSTFGQFALDLQFSQLSVIVGVGDRAGT